MNTDNRKKRTKSQSACHCGDCATCLDNARWERIFREKFADPSYYNRQQGRNSSPMVDL